MTVPSLSALDRRATLGVVALVASSIVATEVLLTRLLSVATYYGLSFAVLSLAMLGLSAGSVDAAAAQARGDALRPWIARRLVGFALGIVLAAVVACTVPIVFAPNLTSFAGVLLVAGASAAPLAMGGGIVARLLGEGTTSLSSLYAVDLACAALGALAPLAMLGPLSAEDALLVVAAGNAAAAAALAPSAKRAPTLALVAGTLVIALVGEATSAGLVVTPHKGQVRAEVGRPIFQAWNAISRVELRPFMNLPASAALWGASPVTPKTNVTASLAVIDGDAGTFVHAYSDLSTLDLLRYDVTSVAHRLRPSGRACVIGVGGGRDILSALVHGHDSVFAVEVNPAMVQMLRAVEDRSPLLRDPRVQIVVGDGRAEMARGGPPCRVLQASLVDTWAATSAGAFAHTEATLYTLEAWRLFLRRVEPDGILTFSRWFDETRSEEAARLVALAVAALEDRGVTRPHEHIALVSARNIATLMVSPAPLGPEDLAQIHAANAELKFNVLIAPDKPLGDTLLDRVVGAPSIDALPAIGEPSGIDTSAATDDRPFFFQLRTGASWLHPLDAIASAKHGGVLAGSSSAMLQLLATALAVLLVGAALLGPTLSRAARSAAPPLPSARAAVYFGALGAGFMMAEIVLVQRMHVVLGHPTYALITVLAALLLATGVGSALSERFVRSRRAVTIAALAAAVLLVVVPHLVIRPLARATAESGLGVRAAWAAATAGTLGVLLGTLFPAGMRYVSRERGAPVALALNGFTSVIGSTLAVIVSVWADIPTTFAVAGGLYLLAAAVGPASWPALEADPAPPEA